MRVDRADTDLMTVADVLARYALSDRRAARRVMDDAGAFKVAGRLFVRRADLIAHEEGARNARSPGGSDTDSPPPRRARPQRTAKARRGRVLPAGFWRQSSALA